MAAPDRVVPHVFPRREDEPRRLLVDVDKERLLTRLERYFDPKVSHDELRREFPSLMTDTRRYNAGDRTL